MKLLIAVGGGGHFSPAMAVIEQLPKDWQVCLVGRKYAFEGDSALSLEYTTAQKLGLPFLTLTTGRLQRKLTPQTFTSLAKIPLGGTQAMKILLTYKPDVVLSFGGYVSVPVTLAASVLRIPVVIHEQTMGAGLANKIAGKIAAKICLSWESSRQFFSANKTVLTGNPLRAAFYQAEHTKHPSTIPTVYITGGSAGAHGINELVAGCLESLLKSAAVFHQTGDSQTYKDYDRLVALKSKLPPSLQNRYTIQKFVNQNEVMDVMNHADIVVSRSGINTVTELLYLGKPCLLIPLPHGQQNEQQTNAAFVQNLGLGKMLDQVRLTPAVLAAHVVDMLQNKESYLHHGKAAHQLIPSDSAQKIISVVQHVYQKNS